MRDGDEDEPGERFHEPCQGVLQAVDRLQALREGDAEDGDDEDPLGGAEVPAVHAEHVEAEQRPDALVGDALAAVPGEQRGEPGLDDDEHERRPDERRHDEVERARRQGEQEDRTR